MSYCKAYKQSADRQEVYAEGFALLAAAYGKPD
jgi:hypothetical protein